MYGEDQNRVITMLPPNGDHYAWWQWFMHAASLGAIGAAIMNLLPTAGTILATFCAVIWYIIQISESKSFVAWVNARKLRGLAKKQARAVRVAAELEASLLVDTARRHADETIKVA